MSLQQPFRQVWREQFGWLNAFYLVIGFIAYAMVFGYQYAYIMGTLIMIVPLVLLRYFQKQSIDRTRVMVSALREKNASLQKSSEEITGLSQALLETLAEVIDLRDPYLSGHSSHVTNFAIQIAHRMGLKGRQLEIIRKSSLLHDIGKLAISEALLGKPDRLSDQELMSIRKHPEMGAQLLENNQSMRSLVPIVRYHHEFFDGNGYPNGLQGSEIPIEARIVSVADAIEAMASDRPYRKGRDLAAIISELERCSGTQFDPRVVQAAIHMLEATGDGMLARTTVDSQEDEPAPAV
jgi:putative nucleotidyltransferase with HDIG domain